MTKTVADPDISISGYNLYRCDRVRRKGGGVCVFIRDSLGYDVIDVPICSGEMYSLHELLYVKIKKSSQIYIFMLVYHPPRPKYQPNTLLDRLGHDVEYLTDTYPTATAHVTGNFNHLNISQFLPNNGLHQVVTGATRGANTLDLLITNRPHEVSCSVVQSCMHMSVLYMFGKR